MNIIERNVQDEGVQVGRAYRLGDRICVADYQEFGPNETANLQKDLGDLSRLVMVDAPLQILSGSDAAEFRRQVENNQHPSRVPKGWRVAWTTIGESLVYATEQPLSQDESNYRLPEEICTALAFWNVRKGELRQSATTIHWNITETKLHLFLYKKDSLSGYDTESYSKDKGPGFAVAALLERAKVDGNKIERMFLTGTNKLVFGFEDWLTETFKEMTNAFIRCEYSSFGNFLRDEKNEQREDIPISFFGAGWSLHTGIGPDFLQGLVPVEPPKETGFSTAQVKKVLAAIRNSVKPAAAGLILGAIIGGGMFFQAYTNETKRGEKLGLQLAEEEKKEKENADIQRQIQDVEARLAVMKKIKVAIETETPKQRSLSNLLKLLQSRYIQGLVLTEFSAEGNQLTFKGYISDTSVYGREGGGPIDAGNLLGQFIRQLEQSGECNNIVPEIKNENDKLALFTVTCNFKGITGKEPLSLPPTSKLLDDARAAAGTPQNLTAQGKGQKQ